MEKLKGKIGLIGTIIVSFLITNIALADGVTQNITLADPLGGSETFTSVANNIILFLSTTVAIPLTAIMVLVGAFQITTAGGDPEKFSSGRKTILYAGIGFVVAVIAAGVTTLINNLINGH